MKGKKATSLHHLMMNSLFLFLQTIPNQISWTSIASMLLFIFIKKIIFTILNELKENVRISHLSLKTLRRVLSRSIDKFVVISLTFSLDSQTRASPSSFTCRLFSRLDCVRLRLIYLFNARLNDINLVSLQSQSPSHFFFFFSTSSSTFLIPSLSLVIFSSMFTSKYTCLRKILF